MLMVVIIVVKDLKFKKFGIHFLLHETVLCKPRILVHSCAMLLIILLDLNTRRMLTSSCERKQKYVCSF